MEEIIGLFAMLIGLAVLALPLWTFLRLHRATEQIRQLNERVAVLERARAEAKALTFVREAAAQPPETVHIADAAPPPPEPIPGISPTPPPPPTEPLPAEPAPPPHTAPAFAHDIERQIGGRWLLYAGLLILLIGISFFLKYAFDNEWVDARGRVVLGVAVGVGLAWGGLRLAHRELRTFGVALTGAGLAVLYLSIYAALAFYGLIDRTTAFALMSIVTAVGVWLANREQAQSLGVIGLGGGFLTPFLVGGDGDAQITLFTYDAILVTATLLLVYRHEWRVLPVVSYVLTFITIAAWSDRYYVDALWLRTLLFLTLFAGLFTAILHKIRTIKGLLGPIVSGLFWTAPIAYHVSALVLTSDHPPALHLYLIVFAVAGVGLTADPHRPWIRLLVLLAAMTPLFGYLVLPSGASWLTANLVTIVVVSGIFLFACVDRVIRQQATLGTPDLITMHLAGLGLYGLLYQTSEVRFPELRGLLAVFVAGVAAGIWWLLRRRDENAALNAAALALTLLAIAVAVQFDGRTVVIGWATEGALIAWIGVRARNTLFRAGGLLLWLAAIAQLSEGYFTTPASFTAVINERSLATLFVLATGYALAWKVGNRETPEGASIRAAIHVVSSILALVWISAEIKSFWEVRYERPQAYLYEELMLSLGWGLYGAAAVVAGMWRSYAPLRYIGIAVIAMTVLKVFFVDLWDLGGIYRVVGFLTLGVLLVLVSYLYQRTRRATPNDQVPGTPGDPVAMQDR